MVDSETGVVFTEITEDRAGQTGELIPIMSMGEIYLNDYPKPGEDHSTYPKAPIDLVWNQNSCLLQNKQTVSRSALYDEYWYVSGLNETMVKHLGDVVKFAHKYAPPLGNDSVVIDIASNDGTLLRQYKKYVGPRVTTVGYDPALNLADVAEDGVEYHYSMCFEAEHYLEHHKKADIITACAVVYHTPEPQKFMDDVKACLADGGVFICEFTYLPMMMRNNAFDSIGHEHITHLSLRSFEQLVRYAGLEIVCAELGDINAGTIICVIKHSPVHKVKQYDVAWLQGLREFEWGLGMGRSDSYLNWAKRGEEIKSGLKSCLENLHEQGKSVYLYGASTKASILLQWVGADYRLIRKAVERNPNKIGRLMVGLEIPIISEEEARRDNPDYMLVGPWCFRDAFIERERDYLKNGGRMIFPLPEIEVVTG